MNYLIVYSHLNPESFSKAIVDEAEKVIKAKDASNEVKIIDLYGDNFNPVLGMPDIAAAFQGAETPADVVKYQELVTWADHISLIFPMWWGQMPAMLKGFIDRVFTAGFAFTYTEEGAKGLLEGKKAQIIINTGSPNEYYAQTGMHDAQKRIMDDGIMGFCGIEAKVEFFGNIIMGTAEERKAYLESVASLY